MRVEIRAASLVSRKCHLSFCRYDSEKTTVLRERRLRLLECRSVWQTAKVCTLTAMVCRPKGAEPVFLNDHELAVAWRSAQMYNRGSASVNVFRYRIFNFTRLLSHREFTHEERLPHAGTAAAPGGNKIL